MARLKIQLFKDSYKSFTGHLDNEGVEYSRRIQLAEIPMAAGMTIEVISTIAQATPWGALAIAVVAWLHARKSRKVIITTNNNKIIHAEGYSAEEVEGFIEQAKSIEVIDTSNEKET